ncbi:MAG: hypothetical protein QXY49_02830 [Thermofilaceae archaeon]
MLKSPCEKLAKYVLPAMRGALITHMYREKRMKQLNIAKLVGVSQSAVSRYVHMERGLYRSLVENVPGIKDLLDETVAKLIEGGTVSMCELCNSLQEKGLLGQVLDVVEKAARSGGWRTSASTV